MNVKYDEIEQYRIENNLTLDEISSQIKITRDVYVNNITGRTVNGQFVRTTPNARNKYKIGKWIKEIFATPVTS